MAKKNKDKSVSLPKAWQSVKHSNETKQTKADIEGVFGLIIAVIMCLFIAFILLGGISQRGFLEFVFNWSENVGHKVSHWLDRGIEVTDDGIYINPDGTMFDNNIGGTTNTGETNNTPTETNSETAITDSETDSTDSTESEDDSSSEIDTSS